MLHLHRGDIEQKIEQDENFLNINQDLLSYPKKVKTSALTPWDILSFVVLI